MAPIQVAYMEESGRSLGARGAAASSGKFTVGAARARASAKEAEVKLESLPRGPRMDRDPEEAGSGLGGAFRDYGGDRGNSLKPPLLQV